MNTKKETDKLPTKKTTTKTAARKAPAKKRAAPKPAPAPTPEPKEPEIVLKTARVRLMNGQQAVFKTPAESAEDLAKIISANGFVLLADGSVLLSPAILQIHVE